MRQEEGRAPTHISIGDAQIFSRGLPCVAVCSGGAAARGARSASPRRHCGEGPCPQRL